LEPEHTDPLVVELKRAMHLVKALLLVGTDLLASPFRNQVLSILYKLKKDALGWITVLWETLCHCPPKNLGIL